MTKALLRDLRVHACIWILALLASWAFGLSALAGMALGLVGTGSSVVGTALITRFLGNTMAESPEEERKKLEGKSSWGGGATVIFFLLKLPIFVACALAAQGLGGPGPAAFGVGILLVYFQLVAWAQSQH